MVALSAGVFIGATFLILLPEAFHETHDRYRAFAPVVLGIVAMYVLGTVLEASGNLGPP
jgi:zinc transporter ZupT